MGNITEQNFFKERSFNSKNKTKKKNEEVLNIFAHERNANLSHVKILPHSC
jgi:hypothetical protein